MQKRETKKDNRKTMVLKTNDEKGKEHHRKWRKSEKEKKKKRGLPVEKKRNAKSEERDNSLFVFFRVN